MIALEPVEPRAHLHDTCPVGLLTRAEHKISFPITTEDARARLGSPSSITAYSLSERDAVSTLATSAGRVGQGAHASTEPVAPSSAAATQ